MTAPIKPPNAPTLEVPSVETIESYLVWLHAETRRYKSLLYAVKRFYCRDEPETGKDGDE